MTTTLAVIDLGGQYCHLIQRRLRDLGVASQVFPAEVDATRLEGYAGVILSGGPRSVYDSDAPKVSPDVLKLGLPVLGICYGHQLLAKLLGAEVRKAAGEYGRTRLSLRTSNSLFKDTPVEQTVWMSHSDSASALPDGIAVLATTDHCATAAFAEPGRHLYGVQFHPEVVHTEFGAKMLENFVRSICLIEPDVQSSGRLAQLVNETREKIGVKSVFFLVSGGVDSTVAFALTAKVVPRERILGVYVDTGLMRKGETEELLANVERIGLRDRFLVRTEAPRFMKALQGVTDPERKRAIIGRLFVEVQAATMKEYGIDETNWLLGQGTIYPDTIESGGSAGAAALIKTHHNRCAEIVELLRRGQVVEPLADLYKDEVRQVGQELGLSHSLTNRWPFPGPGLAIRLLCSTEPAQVVSLPSSLQTVVDDNGYSGVLLPVQSVGVQGDSRTYRRVVAISGPMNQEALHKVSTTLCNMHGETNRVIAHLAGGGHLRDGRVKVAAINEARLLTLREADCIVRSTMDELGITDAVWQFPVVQLPVSFGGDGETIVLRPVNSEDGMTANFAWLPGNALMQIAEKISRLRGVDAVFLDVTNKPPATIEWE